jgi:hypothetical protein
MWKDAFDRVNTELDLANRKKQALDTLLGSGRISQFTYDCICKDLNEEIGQIEIRRKALTDKMTNKLSELEEQQQTLEFFLANSEMAYAAGEINDELHARECSALSLGLDAVKQELNWIREVIIQLVPKEALSPASAPSMVEGVEATSTPTPIENIPSVTAAVPLEAPVEATPVVGKVAIEKPSQVVVETATEGQS